MQMKRGVGGYLAVSTMFRELSGESMVFSARVAAARGVCLVLLCLDTRTLTFYSVPQMYI